MVILPFPTGGHLRQPMIFPPMSWVSGHLNPLIPYSMLNPIRLTWIGQGEPYLLSGEILLWNGKNMTGPLKYNLISLSMERPMSWLRAISLKLT